MQTRKQVNNTDFVVVENFAVVISFSKAFMDANFKAISPEIQMAYLISSSLLALKDTDHEDTSVA